MEIKTTSTRVIKTAETTTENAMYRIEYENSEDTLTKMNVNVSKVEEVEFPMEDGMHKDMQETYVGNIYYENGYYTIANFPESAELPKYISDTLSIAEQLKKS